MSNGLDPDVGPDLKLFVNVISRCQKSPLARKELMEFESSDDCSSFLIYFKYIEIFE